MTHPIPMEYMKGFEPSVGQMLRSWNMDTFHISSNMTWGSFTG